jgi:hypothetical protein
MKHPASKVVLIASLFAVACTVAVPAMLAADDAAKKKRADADLKKYDKNGNGKLDPDEEAARQADLKKSKEEKKKK